MGFSNKWWGNWQAHTYALANKEGGQDTATEKEEDNGEEGKETILLIGIKTLTRRKERLLHPLGTALSMQVHFHECTCLLINFAFLQFPYFCLDWIISFKETRTEEKKSFPVIDWVLETEQNWKGPALMDIIFYFGKINDR